MTTFRLSVTRVCTGSRQWLGRRGEVDWHGRTGDTLCTSSSMSNSRCSGRGIVNSGLMVLKRRLPVASYVGIVAELEKMRSWANIGGSRLTAFLTNGSEADEKIPSENRSYTPLGKPAR